jgi:hypothetical protein
MWWLRRFGAGALEEGTHGAAYLALKNGTIDANNYDISVFTGFSMQEVAPYWIRGLENDHCTGHIVVNMKVWKSLSKSQQDAMASAALEYANALNVIYQGEIQKVQDMVKAGTVKEVQLDKDAIALAQKNAMAIGAGHSFILFLGDGFFPINVLNAIKSVPEVAHIFCATSNPTDVLIAKTDLGRGILGVVDGSFEAFVGRHGVVLVKLTALR